MRQIGNSLALWLATRPEFKIFTPIVISDSIFMVYLLMALKITAEYFFHNEPMFKNIWTGFRGRRVVGSIDLDVAMSVAHSPTSLPIRVTRSLKNSILNSCNFQPASHTPYCEPACPNGLTNLRDGYPREHRADVTFPLNHQSIIFFTLRWSEFLLGYVEKGPHSLWQLINRNGSRYFWPSTAPSVGCGIPAATTQCPEQATTPNVASEHLHAYPSLFLTARTRSQNHKPSMTIAVVTNFLAPCIKELTEFIWQFIRGQRIHFWRHVPTFQCYLWGHYTRKGLITQ